MNVNTTSTQPRIFGLQAQSGICGRAVDNGTSGLPLKPWPVPLPPPPPPPPPPRPAKPANPLAPVRLSPVAPSVTGTEIGPASIGAVAIADDRDRKSTRLNSSH